MIFTSNSSVVGRGTHYPESTTPGFSEFAICSPKRRGGPLWVKSSHSVKKKYYHLSGWYWGKAATRHSAPVAASGKSGQFQSGQINEYEWLLSATSGHSTTVDHARYSCTIRIVSMIPWAMMLTHRFRFTRTYEYASTNPIKPVCTTPEIPQS